MTADIHANVIEHCNRPWSRARSRRGMAALALLASVCAAGRAAADTVFIEAEGLPMSDRQAGVTSPLLIKDDDAASSGRYLTVAVGKNSLTAPPASEGVATYRFGVANEIRVQGPDQEDTVFPTSGVYRIWARVSAPSTSDDSFWVRMEKAGAPGSILVKWNGIEPGASWHWTLVKGEGAAGPAQFPLAPGDHELQISYREDGAKLDLLVITDDPDFNPKAPPQSAPAQVGDVTEALAVPVVSTAGARSAIKVMWSEVPGAVSYTVRRVLEAGRAVLKTGLTTHAFTDLALPPPDQANCYDVLAVFPQGPPREPSPFFSTCQGARVSFEFVDNSAFSAAPPMVLNNNTITSLPGTPSSLAAPPEHGRARLDFQVGGSAKVQVWFLTDGLDKSHDSFWARMDSGAWIKWNNIPDFCAPVSDADAGGARVTFSLAPGSHTFELAQREPGTSLSNVFFITDNLHATAGGLCND